MIVPLPLSSEGERRNIARTKLTFKQFDIHEDPDTVVDKICDAFNATFRGLLTIDELLLYPRDAMAFCDRVRMTERWFGLPDDMILRPIMNRRKNPEA